MSQLVKYDEACRALAAARSVDEVKKIRDVSVAMKAYAKQAKNKQLLADAQAIEFRAVRRLGEMIEQQKQTVGLNRGGGERGVGRRGMRVQNGPALSKPTLAAAGIDKHLADRARKFAAVPQERFESLVGAFHDRVSREGERVTANLLREGNRATRDEKLRAPPIVGRYALLYADPPWRYEHVKTESRAIENQYPTLALEEIKALEVPGADDCVLFLWATSPKLAEALEVLAAWRFVYRTCAVWDKEVIGMGYYFRQQHELLLVATRGSPGAPEPSLRCPSVIRSRRGEHSRKPEEFYRLLEHMYPQLDERTRCELFQREPRTGWAGWGNEVGAAAA